MSSGPPRQTMPDLLRRRWGEALLTTTPQGCTVRLRAMAFKEALCRSESQVSLPPGC